MSYYIKDDSIIAFSGGRTSAFMLYQIIQAHGGKLPTHIKVFFANTGLEHTETYKFVERCSVEWNVEITWVEFDFNQDGGKSYKIVNYSNCSRSGEPFNKVIKMRGFLPNRMTRFCSSEMKARTMNRVGWEIFPDGYTEIVGLRYDEPRRVMNLKPDRVKNTVYCPMYNAKHTLEDVTNFWSKNHFDLGIPNYLGNCVGCFLKSPSKIEMICRTNGDHLRWWIDKESEYSNIEEAKSKTFRSDGIPYKVFLKMVEDQPSLFSDEETIPCNCTD